MKSSWKRQRQLAKKSMARLHKTFKFVFKMVGAVIKVVAKIVSKAMESIEIFVNGIKEMGTSIAQIGGKE
ncbi:hypothetical protein [Lactococcus sp.]|uniref:hypothetical protein n=1 Tax=Lactococcus sp. TaxID=44273 RepID=UPI0035B1FF48